MKTQSGRSSGQVSHERRPASSAVCQMLAVAATTYTGMPSVSNEILQCERCVTYLRHSSTISRCVLTLMTTIAHRSWLKLWRMTAIPFPSLPSVFETGTRTLSNVTNAVPAAEEYAVLIGLVDNPSQRGTRMTVYPPLVLQPTVK